MKNRKKLLKRIGIPAVALVLAGSIGLSLISAPAVATDVDSLPHIEEIVDGLVASRESFTILEIVPESGSGSIGYYVGGQEPVAGWRTAVAGIAGSAEREQYMAQLVANLKNRGILGDYAEVEAPTTPMSLLGAYDEVYPWETVPDGAEELALNTPETHKLKGAFDAQEGGPYKQNNDYRLDLANGTYRQVVDKFVRYDEAAAEKPVGYYYKPVFTELQQADAVSGTTVYTEDYVKAGTVKLTPASLDFAVDATQTYYSKADGAYTALTPNNLTPGDIYCLKNDTDIYTVTKTEVIKTDGFTPVEGTTYYSLADGVYTPLTAEALAALAADTTVYTLTDEAKPGKLTAATIGFDVDATKTYYRFADGVYVPLPEGALDAYGGRLPADGTEIWYGSGNYTCYGTIGAPDFKRMIWGYLYYRVETANTGEPTEGWSADKPYYAVSSSFALAGGTGAENGGYFYANLYGYEYVGAGEGSFEFIPATDGGTEYDVACDTVFFTGGFINNEWFLSEVLDCSESEMRLTSAEVVSVTPAQLVELLKTRGALISDEADLVVLSAGLDIATGGVPATVYGGANDLNAYVAESLYDRSVAGLPFVTDYRLTGSDTNTGALAKLTLTEAFETGGDFAALRAAISWETPASTNFVRGVIAENKASAVYCFDPSTAVGAFATGSFLAQMDASAYAEGGGFHAVIKEIDDENFLRDISVEEEASLAETVSMATATRYIINFAGRRITNAKTKIKVLEIQPGRGSEITKKQILEDWLGMDGSAPDDLEEKDVTIVTMSTSELIGKIEDLVEVYDLIYVGVSNTGFNMGSDVDGDGDEDTKYNDGGMNGLLYSNIGDLYRTNGLQFAGLLDRDYSNTTFTYNNKSYKRIQAGSGTNANLFRFSGNDITEAKLDELKDFAIAGYPVIFADDLTFGKTVGEEKQFSFMVAATGTDASTGNAKKVKLSAAVSAATGEIPEDAEFTYTWYRRTYQNGNEWVDGGKEVTANLPNNSDSRTYYCVASLYYGGNTYSATSNYVTATKTSGLTVAEGTGALPAIRGNTSYTFYIGGGYSYYSGKYYAYISGLDNVAGVSYQWEYSYDGTTWYDAGAYWYQYALTSWNANTSTSVRVRCEVTIPGAEPVYSKDIYAYYQQLWSGGYWSFSTPYDNETTVTLPGTTEYFRANVTQTQQNNGIRLRASASPDVDGESFRWYRVNENGSDFAVDNGNSRDLYLGNSATAGDYYCVISVTEGGVTYTARSNNWTVKSSGLTIEYSGNGYPSGTITIKAESIHETGDDINTVLVDNASYMYKMLTAIKGYSNVMTVYTAERENDTLVRYLNLSKPTIVFADDDGDESNGISGMPNVYGDAVNTNSLAGRELRYEFSITNETDPTPADTFYLCELFVDANADGLYSAGERLPDIKVVKKDTGALVGADRLQAGTVYVVTRTLPDDYVGILPWKLKITKADETNLHTSKISYAHIKPTAPTDIFILQIRSDRSNNHVNLEQQQEKAGSGYYGIYGQLLADVKDFNVTIYAVYADALDNLGAGSFTTSNFSVNALNWLVREGFLKNENGGYSYVAPEGDDTGTVRQRLLEQFNMVIIGFDDMYQELSAETATDIVSFSKTRAVLFTHDTTSQANVPFSAYETTSGTIGFGGDVSYWGYNFNTVLRDAVKLDRYGVTSTLGVLNDDGTRAGRTYKSWVASGSYGSVTASLLKDKYSVGYVPKTENPVAEVQGYNNYALIRYGSGSYMKPTGDKYSGGRETTWISQVNEGQITRYPYNVNTQYFKTGSGSNYMQVGSTHESYYQLNLNSENIVVWYCMSNGTGGTDNYYNATPNDVINSYYIFSCGNITYSGMGHAWSDVSGNYKGSDISQQYKNEAMLFVNTMVASFRTADAASKIDFTTDASGLNVAKYVILTSDGGTILEGDAKMGDADCVYFRFTDTNLGTGKTTVKFYYAPGEVKWGAEGITELEMPVYFADDSTQTTAVTSLTNGRVYKARLPESLLSRMAGESATSINRATLFVKVSTEINNKTYESVSSLDIRKITLFELG